MKMTCPHCGVIGSAHDSLPGAKVRCPQCDKVFKVTEEEVTCPHCAVTGSAFGSVVGTKFRCPQCDKVFLLPEEELAGPPVSDSVIAGGIEEIVPTEAAIVAEPLALSEVEPVLMPESMDSSELELAAELDERQSVPEMEAKATSRPSFTGIQASVMAMGSSVAVEKVVPTKAAIVAEPVALPEVEPVSMPESMDSSELELAVELDERQSVPEMEAKVASRPSFTGIQASPMAMESSFAVEKVVPTKVAIVAESLALPEEEPVSMPESKDISELELAAERDERQSVPEKEAKATYRPLFTGIQASPMAMESSVAVEKVVPTKVAIVAESVALPEVEPVSIPASMDSSELELVAELKERQSVPEMEAKAASRPSFTGIQASALAMESSEEAVIELPQEVVTGVADVPEMEPELEMESQLALELVAELEPEPEAKVEPESEPEPEIASEPELALEPELEPESVFEQIPEVKPEEMVEPAGEISLEPAVIPAPESIAELTLESAPAPAPAPEKVTEPLPEPEIVTELAPEPESVASIIEESVPSDAGEKEPVAEEPAPPILPTQICKGCGESFHPQLLQEVEGKSYCGVCQLRIAATTEPASRFRGGKLRAVLAAILLLGLMALIGLALVKFGIL